MQLNLKNNLTSSFYLVLLLSSGNIFGSEGVVTFLNDVDLTLGQSSNMSQSELTLNKIEDRFITLNYSLLANFTSSEFQAITFKAYVESQQQQRISELNRISVGGQFIYRWQHGLGYFKPFFQFNLSLQRDQFGADQRDNNSVKSQLLATKRLTDALVVTTGLEYKRQYARASVFDLQQNRFFIGLDYNTKNDSTYYAAYSFTKGDIWSSARNILCDGSVVSDMTGIQTWAKDKTTDDAFNEFTCGNWMSYKLAANTHSLSLGYNSALTERSTIDATILWVNSNAAANINYGGNIIRLSYLLRF